jgi:hypothetical protein
MTNMETDRLIVAPVLMDSRLISPVLGHAVFDQWTNKCLTKPLPTRNMAEEAMSLIATSGVLR